MSCEPLYLVISATSRETIASPEIRSMSQLGRCDSFGASGKCRPVGAAARALAAAGLRRLE